MRSNYGGGHVHKYVHWPDTPPACALGPLPCECVMLDWMSKSHEKLPEHRPIKSPRQQNLVGSDIYRVYEVHSWSELDTLPLYIWRIITSYMREWRKIPKWRFSLRPHRFQLDFVRKSIKRKRTPPTCVYNKGFNSLRLRNKYERADMRMLGHERKATIVLPAYFSAIPMDILYSTNYRGLARYRCPLDDLCDALAYMAERFWESPIIFEAILKPSYMQFTVHVQSDTDTPCVDFWLPVSIHGGIRKCQVTVKYYPTSVPRHGCKYQVTLK